MSLDRTDLVTQKGSVSNVSGSDVSVSNLGTLEASLDAVKDAAESSSESLSGTTLSTEDVLNTEILKQILTQLKILTIHHQEITGELITEQDIT